MKIIALILSFFLLLRLLVALSNFIWVKLIHRKIQKQATAGVKWSLLIPARNEQENIAKLLSDVCEIEDAPSQIIIYDDNSSDNTAGVAKGFMAMLPQLRVIGQKGAEPPVGWLGKNNGCHQLSKEASGDYLLFVDADVRLGKETGKWVSYAASRNISLLSLFPVQITDTLDSRRIVPIMNWILLSLLPLPLTRHCSWSSFSAANGQFMLFNASAYHNLEPHSLFRSSHAEDIAISRYFKKKGYSIATLTGDHSVRCRMYNTRREAINGFSKNVFHFFGGSAVATVAFVLATTSTPLFLIAYGLWAYILWLLAVASIRILVSAASRQDIRSNTELLFVQHYYFILIVYKAFINRSRKTLIWKGRNIYQ